MITLSQYPSNKCIFTALEIYRIISLLLSSHWGLIITI